MEGPTTRLVHGSEPLGSTGLFHLNRTCGVMVVVAQASDQTLARSDYAEGNKSNGMFILVMVGWLVWHLFKVLGRLGLTLLAIFIDIAT